AGGAGPARGGAGPWASPSSRTPGRAARSPSARVPPRSPTSLPPPRTALADDDAPRPLPPREPRPLIVHWAIDAAVVSLLTVVVAIFLGAALITIAIAAVIAGVFLAPLTRTLAARART